jgi:hypothetical protein
VHQSIILSNSGEHCGQEDQLVLWRSATRAGDGNFDQYKFKFKFKFKRPKVRREMAKPEFRRVQGKKDPGGEIYAAAARLPWGLRVCAEPPSVLSGRASAAGPVLLRQHERGWH